MPRLDVSTLSDDELAVKIGHLFRIRQMEKVSSAEAVFKKILNVE